MNSKIDGLDAKAWAGHDTVVSVFVKGKSVLFYFSIGQELLVEIKQMPSSWIQA